MSIGHISDTARWVAYYRAMETERPDALFRDPWARELAGPQGERIVQGLRRGEATAWAMIVRTVLFDAMIRKELQDHQVDLVVNLAAGLDTRPWRMELPEGLRWVDVDLPPILDHKLAVMESVRPRCAYEPVRADLAEEGTRPALLAEVAEGAQRTLVVTEGLLIYLTAVQVTSLARDLRAVESAASWIIDLANPRLLAIMRRAWGKQADQGGASFRFAPEEGTAFFLPMGWRETEFRSTWDESYRLNRTMRLAWLWRFLGRLQSRAKQEEARRMSGAVRLERVSAPEAKGKEDQGP